MFILTHEKLQILPVLPKLTFHETFFFLCCLVQNAQTFSGNNNDDDDINIKACDRQTFSRTSGTPFCVFLYLIFGVLQHWRD